MKKGGNQISLVAALLFHGLPSRILPLLGLFQVLEVPQGPQVHMGGVHPRPALAKEPCQITLLDAYRAVEGDKPLLHQDTHTNPACGVGVNIQLVLRDCYDLVQARAEESMRSITLQEILDRYTEKLTYSASKLSE